MNVRISEQRLRIYKHLIEGLSITEVSKKLNISVPAVYRHKEELIRSRYLDRKGNNYIRGPNAKFIDEAEKRELFVKDGIGQTIIPFVPLTPSELTPLCMPDLGRPSSPPPQASPSPGPSPPPATMLTADVPDVRIHLEGSIMFEVEKLGDMGVMKVETEEIRIFDPDPYNISKGSQFYKGKLDMPGKGWRVSLQVQITPTRTILYIWPPELRMTRTELEADPQARAFPEQFFREDVFDIIHLLEKYGGWRFVRTDGKITGKNSGKVHYAVMNQEVSRTIPPGLRGIDGQPDVWIDESTGSGKREIESYHIKNTMALLTAGDRFDNIDRRIEELDKILRLREVAILERMSRILERIELIARAQDMETGLTLADTARVEPVPETNPTKPREKNINNGYQ